MAKGFAMALAPQVHHRSYIQKLHHRSYIQKLHHRSYSNRTIAPTAIAPSLLRCSRHQCILHSDSVLTVDAVKARALTDYLLAYVCSALETVLAGAAIDE
jgi:hypothetical protein